MKRLIRVIDTEAFSTNLFRICVVACLVLIGSSAYRNNLNLEKTQADIAKRGGHRYTAEEAAKDMQRQDARFSSLEKRISILEVELKRQKQR